MSEVKYKNGGKRDEHFGLIYTKIRQFLEFMDQIAFFTLNLEETRNMKLHDTSKTADFSIEIEVNLEQKHCNNVQLHEICDKIRDREIRARKKF